MLPKRSFTMPKEAEALVKDQANNGSARSDEISPNY